MNWRAVLALTFVGAMVAACGGNSTPSAQPTTPAPTTPTTPTVATSHPRPVKTIVVSGPTYRLGQTGTVTNAAEGVVVRLTATGPSVSRTRLSPTYGYPPQHGYYVTFSMSVVNAGSQTVQIGPLDFFAQVPGMARVTTQDGNAHVSGAGSQFDNTFLNPGESYSAPLTYDVSSTHGVLSYAPDGSPAVSWRF